MRCSDIPLYCSRERYYGLSTNNCKVQSAKRKMQSAKCKARCGPHRGVQNAARECRGTGEIQKGCIRWLRPSVRNHCLHTTVQSGIALLFLHFHLRPSPLQEVHVRYFEPTVKTTNPCLEITNSEDCDVSPLSEDLAGRHKSRLVVIGRACTMLLRFYTIIHICIR